MNTLALAITGSFMAVVVAQEGVPSEKAVELRITDAKGEPVRSANVELLSVVGGKYFEIFGGRVSRALVPADFREDRARLDDLPSGVFVLRVEADGQTLTFSEQFQVPSRTVPQLDVRMQEGALLEGVVNDVSGKAVAGAIVRTEPGGEIAANAGRIRTVGREPARTTSVVSARTGADGSFRIPLLAPGDYCVVAEHPDFAPTELPLRLSAAEQKKLPRVVLPDGAILSGIVTRGERRVIGARVTVLLPATATRPDGQALTMMTDELGAYRTKARVAVGSRITLHACGAGELEPRQVLWEMEATRRTAEVKKPPLHFEDIDLPRL